MTKPFLLTTDNYYSPEADQAYFSCSQYQTFAGLADQRPCEARAMAKILGKYQEKESDALLYGNYFHTALEGEEAHEAFCEAHFDKIYKTKETKARGLEIVGKYAGVEQLDKCLLVARADKTFRKLIDSAGENEVILTGSIFGQPWRIRCDKLLPKEHIIVDWKTAASLTEMHYDPEKKERVTFVEHWGYLHRAAIYGEIYYQNFGVHPLFVLACVTKQDPPDKGIYYIDPVEDRLTLDYELDKVRERLGQMVSVKERRQAPRRCGECAYCRATKKDVPLLPYHMLRRENRTEPDYDEFVPWHIDPDTGEVLGATA